MMCLNLCIYQNYSAHSENGTGLLGILYITKMSYFCIVIKLRKKYFCLPNFKKSIGDAGCLLSLMDELTEFYKQYQTKRCITNYFSYIC